MGHQRICLLRFPQGIQVQIFQQIRKFGHGDSKSVNQDVVLPYVAMKLLEMVNSMVNSTVNTTRTLLPCNARPQAGMLLELTSWHWRIRSVDVATASSNGLQVSK